MRYSKEAEDRLKYILGAKAITDDGEFVYVLYEMPPKERIREYYVGKHEEPRMQLEQVRLYPKAGNLILRYTRLATARLTPEPERGKCSWDKNNLDNFWLNGCGMGANEVKRPHQHFACHNKEHFVALIGHLPYGKNLRPCIFYCPVKREWW